MKKDIQLLFREQLNPIVEKLREEGKKIYSISRINTFNGCLRNYYYTYIDKQPQKIGIYGFLGSSAHSDLEDLYTNKTKKLEAINFKQDWQKSEIFGINFPTGKIKDNYRDDINEHYYYYKKMEGEFISELGFLLKLDDEHFLMGYIDLVKFNENANIDIYDFKTSAMFTGEKLKEAGRQLIIYSMAMEQLYGLKTDKVAWQMLKYLQVQIGYNKPKVASARKWVEECCSQIRTLMKKQGVESQLIDMMLALAIEINSISKLPQEIQDMIKVDTYTMEYEINNKLKEETLTYIKETIETIEKMDETDITEWYPNPNKFFCDNLCGFGGTKCHYGK